jgi:sulfate transport system substrate-binding protein
LEHEAEALTAPPRALGLRERREVGVVDAHQPRVRSLEPADQTQQGRLAGAAAPHDGDELTALDGHARAVENGLPADIVALSLEPDVTRLIEPGLVAEDWNAGDYRGMVTDSLVVFVVRPGNPKGIATWDDLVQEGVEVITPNPLTSGGARWNILAAWGAQAAQGKSDEAATDYLRQLFAHVPVQDKSARESVATFAGGKGDVLLSYENEAITAQQKGEKLEFMVPPQTILIENPVAVVTESAHPDAAAAFVAFLRTQEAQRIFGKHGYRPVVPEVLAEFDYPAPEALVTIADLGGWPDATARFFDPDNGIVARVQQR